MAGMEDAWVRVNRAKERFQILKDEIAAFRRDHPKNESVAADHDGKGNVRLLARVKERPPREWGLAAGDLLVDLRCALDYAVYALAIGNSGSDPPEHAARLEFPISVGDTRWKEAIGRRKLNGLDPHAVEYIRSIQPPDDTNALLLLEELVGVNKHRFISVAWLRLDSTLLKLRFEGVEKPFTADAKHIPGELKDGAELITFHVPISPKGAKFQIEAALSIRIAIESPQWGLINLLDFGGQIGAYIEHVVGELERFLTPGHEAPPPGTPIPLTPWGWPES